MPAKTDQAIIEAARVFRNVDCRLVFRVLIRRPGITSEEIKMELDSPLPDMIRTLKYLVESGVAEEILHTPGSPALYGIRALGLATFRQATQLT